MFNVTRRVSFSVVIALLLGWGAMSLMIFQSSNYLIAAETEDGMLQPLPRGIKLAMLVDKKVYRGGEPVLISLRNDSRKKIWLATNALGCGEGWWALERLGSDEDDWRVMSRTKTSCTKSSTGLDSFTKGTLRTDEWDGLVQAPAIGEVFLPAETGTYRIIAPYLTGEAKEADWQTVAEPVTSTSFTIQ